MASTAAPPAKTVPQDTGKDSDDEAEDDIESQQYKICVLGDGSVGKTSIVMRFTQDYFAATYKQTLGIDFFLGTVVFPRGTATRTEAPAAAGTAPAKAPAPAKVSNVPVHVALQCLDIGGQAIGSKMMSSYIHGADAVLLVYDITNALSFENLRDWLDVVKQTYEEKKEPLPYLALVGNKVDLEYMRAVKVEKHNQFAKDENLHTFMVSAKTADGIKSTFHRVAAELAKVQLTKAELESASVAAVVKAQVINHQQHDPTQAPLVLKTGPTNNKCIVM